MTSGYGLLGAGAQAAEAQEWRGKPADFFFVDDAWADPTAGRYGSSSVPDELTVLPVAAAVGPPAVRRRLVGLWSGSTFSTIVSAHAVVSGEAQVGDGSLIGPLAVLSVGVAVGRHCLINIGATLSHDTQVDDFATVSPGAHVAGRCRIGAGAVVGVGASLLPGVSIGAGAIIGAGAVLTRDADPGGVYVGVPARKIDDRIEWATSI
ncbi:DapH/DapD/GlmU-related protein [Cellulomonas sp. C5510]|uniref:DapH/DapD/GlmU-related protein n=1 Tax=Cellulomonas sp. C5510 TaxID=2871170 RepID=UPI001C957F45|nr:DapH/DapD/GlmU-related protein [Cellulomonas sp. C5510]QZN84779.1 hypothetical protein K5O09_13240 [Cellulomonas sp. C5510]